MVMMEKKEGQTRICVATCIYGVDAVPYSSHLSFMYRIGRNLPNVDVIFSGPWRMPIDVARNKAVEIALHEECDYLFFYDDDMVLHPNVLANLLNHAIKREIHIISAKVYIRGYPFKEMIFRFNDPEHMGLFSPTPADIDEDGLVKCDAVGCASTLINTELFKMVDQPWFLTGRQHTEDVYFCMKTREHIEGVQIYMDMNTECGHMLDKPVLTSVSKSVLLGIQEKGLTAIWEPNLSGKEKAETFSEEVFEPTPSD